MAKSRTQNRGMERETVTARPVRNATPQRSLPATPHLDPIVHERMRLAILSALAVNRRLSFNELKRLLEVTDGNLSVHTRKLEEAGYLECSKFFEGRMPKTEYRLTASGRRALEDYLQNMEALIRATRG